MLKKHTWFFRTHSVQYNLEANFWIIDLAIRPLIAGPGGQRIFIAPPPQFVQKWYFKKWMPILKKLSNWPKKFRQSYYLLHQFGFTIRLRVLVKKINRAVSKQRRVQKKCLWYNATPPPQKAGSASDKPSLQRRRYLFLSYQLPAGFLGKRGGGGGGGKEKKSF